MDLSQNISVVIPVFNEEKSIIPLYEKLTDVLKKLGSTYEIIFVDDGSSDKTPQILSSLVEQDNKVTVGKLSKRFGKSFALMTGFHLSHGDLVLTLDGDLQDDPQDIPVLLEKIQQPYDVVVGWRVNRKDSISKKIPSKIYNLLVNWFTGISLHDSCCNVKAMTNKAVKNIYIYGGFHRYMMSIFHHLGFTIGEVKVRHHRRAYGKSKYGITRLFSGLLDLLILTTYLSLKKTDHFTRQDKSFKKLFEKHCQILTNASQR